jgi:hypothetical protein
MYLSVVTAKRATKCHDSWFDENNEPYPQTYRAIKAGEKYLKISNGTIGQGARQRNINAKDAIEYLEALLKSLKGERLPEGHNHYYQAHDDDIPF